MKNRPDIGADGGLAERPAANSPATRHSLRAELVALGLPAGGIVLVHSSLRAMGYVCGGPVAVVQALLDVLTPDGTLVVPSQTPQNRDPARWVRQVPADWWPTIREHLPAFDPAVHDCRAMGMVAETVRTWPGAVRSQHPQTSFAAVGPRAAELMARHDLDSELGERSPLAALDATDAHTLLLGVGYDRCTAFHLAEYRLPRPPEPHRNACVVLGADGQRQWRTYVGARLDAGPFSELGRDFERDSSSVATGPVGRAVARLLPIRPAVAYARAWLTLRCPDGDSSSGPEN